MVGRYKLAAPVLKTGSRDEREVGALPTPSANLMNEECDLCHDFFHLDEILFNGVQFLCYKCRGEKEFSFLGDLFQ